MGKEVEVKFLNVNKNEIIKKLKSLKAKKIFEGKITTSYYDYPDNRLKQENKTLRLRKKGNKAELTSKQKIIDKGAKISKEKNFIAKNIKPIKFILKSVGLEQVSEIPEKYRISYKLGSIQFELDKYKNLPVFLEIESDSIEKLKKAAKLLNLNFDDAKTFNAFEVIDYLKKE